MKRKLFSVSLPESELEFLAEYAEKDNQKPTDLVRSIVHEWINKIKIRSEKNV